MASEIHRTYWDSCIFIDGLRKTEDRWDRIQELELDAKAGRSVLYTSALAIAEVVKLQKYGQLTENELRQINAYFRHKFVKVVPVDRIVAKRAAEIVRDFGLKPPDAIHVATAIRTKCCVLYTYDGEGGDPDKLLAMNGKIGSPAIPIKMPGEFGQNTMFGAG